MESENDNRTMRRRAKFGIVIPQSFDFPRALEVASTCEKLGLDSIWIQDHFFLSREKPYFETLTMLSALAASTNKVRLGTLVLCNPYRPPPLLAKMVSTLDVISNGRVELGIGAGWNAEEHVAYGYPFPKPVERVDMLEEAILIIKKMWCEEKASFSGKYYKIHKATCLPKPIQKPHPPIWIGGHRNRMLKIAAKYGNGWNHIRISPKDFKSYVKKLRSYCDHLNRGFNQFEKSLLTGLIVGEDENQIKKIVKDCKKEGKSKISDFISFRYLKSAIRGPEGIVKYAGKLFGLHSLRGTIAGAPQECANMLRQYIDAGATYFMLELPQVHYIQSMKLLAREVIPKL